MSDEDDGYIDIGHDHAMRFYGWSPCRELNPQYASIPDIEKMCVHIKHKAPDGSDCGSCATFDTPEVRRAFPEIGDKHLWQVVQWEPLTISPSLLCARCKDHGFIREGKWVPA